MATEEYGRDYFECGLAVNVSLYADYRWIPGLTIPLAMTYVDLLGLTRKDTILDFGAAKGFVVKALRMLHREAYGCDVSEYAVNSADPEVSKYLRHCNGEIVPFDQKFSWIISKDVFEHIQERDLQTVLLALRYHGNRMFAIIPLGERDSFIVPAYHLDKTHKLAKDVQWWENSFNKAGWYVKQFDYRVPGIKDNWSSWSRGNGFFILS